MNKDDNYVQIAQHLTGGLVWFEAVFITSVCSTFNTDIVGGLNSLYRGGGKCVREQDCQWWVVLTFDSHMIHITQVLLLLLKSSTRHVLLWTLKDYQTAVW